MTRYDDVFDGCDGVRAVLSPPTAASASSSSSALMLACFHVELMTRLPSDRHRVTDDFTTATSGVASPAPKIDNASARNYYLHYLLFDKLPIDGEMSDINFSHARFILSAASRP